MIIILAPRDLRPFLKWQPLRCLWEPAEGWGTSEAAHGSKQVVPQGSGCSGPHTGSDNIPSSWFKDHWPTELNPNPYLTQHPRPTPRSYISDLSLSASSHFPKLNSFLFPKDLLDAHMSVSLSFVPKPTKPSHNLLVERSFPHLPPKTGSHGHCSGDTYEPKVPFSDQAR